MHSKTLTVARNDAMTLLGQIACKRNPLEVREREARAAVTRSQVLDAFKLARKNLNPNTVRDYQQFVDKAWHPEKRRRTYLKPHQFAPWYRVNPAAIVAVFVLMLSAPGHAIQNRYREPGDRPIVRLHPMLRRYRRNLAGRLRPHSGIRIPPMGSRSH